MKTYAIDNIRNLALISHGGAGKTSLAEALLFSSGAINRLGNIEAGNTTTDYDPDEIKRQVTINTTLAPLEWQGVKINLLDAPGYFDFVGDVVGALRVVDCALLVVCAVSGVEVGTEKMWGYADDLKLPRAVFINKMDRENADFDKTMSKLQEFFGPSLVPLQMPIGKESSLEGIVDLVEQVGYLFSAEGKEVKKIEIPESLQEKANSLREKLIEAVAETDDELLMKYLEGEELDQEEIHRSLRQGIQQRKIVPILCGAATANLGGITLLEAISRYFPSPADMGPAEGTLPGSDEAIMREPKADQPLSALVYKTLADPYVGRINYFRVYSGTLKPDSQVLNASQDKLERIGQIFTMRGKTQISLQEVPAGDIAAVAKLQHMITGDTFCDRNHPIVYPRPDFPQPVISFAIEPKTKGEEEKVSSGITRFLEEDPTLRLERRAETKQAVLLGLGDLHIEIVANRLAQKFGVEVELSTPRVPYKETIKGQARVEGKHKKQTGGRGQYGHVKLRLIPQEAGKGYEFVNNIVGGAVPGEYIPAVDVGIQGAMESGILGGYEVVDVRVELYDGSYHEVDSSEMAFKIAGSMAFKDGMKKAKPVLLEPYMRVEVTTPEIYMGDVMGELQSRRGRIEGMESRTDGTQVIKSFVPLAEMFGYATDLRSRTQGRGVYVMQLAHYEEVPKNIMEKIIAQ